MSDDINNSVDLMFDLSELKLGDAIDELARQLGGKWKLMQEPFEVMYEIPETYTEET